MLLWLAASPPAQAHLMVAQRGTLNIVGDGAFMVLSLPVSAFSGIDDDGDGKLSAAEFAAHRATIASAVTREVRVLDEQGARPLEGVMLSPAPPDEAPTQPAAQLVVLGRFALRDATSPLRFEVDLFGKTAAERTFQITVTRASKTETQLLVLTPQQPARALFPSAWSVFADYVVIGAEHIVTGLDHLLFLLVVLAASWGWRQAMLALTTFTAGHAITLAISVLGGWSVPAAVVEPTIAATIVGMAAFDFYSRRRGLRLPRGNVALPLSSIPAGDGRRKAASLGRSTALRLSLVFACALIHGLGLASALTELGLDGRHQWTSLAGFNVGIELGQLAVALMAGIVAIGIRRMRGDHGLALATRLASFSAIGMGGIWFVQRVLGVA
jgi:HupE / UreJ protein